jgi:carbon monoxide dehydrogenase subunit G
MPGPVVVAVEIPAPREAVWAELATLEDHVEWMQDAHRIEFLGEQRRGVGTRMEVETRFGPLRTSDVMEFTAWDEPASMAVHHRGLFTGTGEFTLTETPGGGTRVEWREHIQFPWFFLGPAGAWAARPVFRFVWRRNLQRLRQRLSGL